MKLIPIYNSTLFTMVDDKDFEKASKQKWILDVNGYATDRNGTSCFLHHFIFGRKPGKLVDHRDRNKLNNQKYNLRFATKSQNAANSKLLNTRNRSGFRGVSFYKRDRNWIASIMVNQRSKHLGYYDAPEAAARAYDKAALHYFKEFATLNFPNRAGVFEKKELVE